MASIRGPTSVESIILAHVDIHLFEWVERMRWRKRCRTGAGAGTGG